MLFDARSEGTNLFSFLIDHLHFPFPVIFTRNTMVFACAKSISFEKHLNHRFRKIRVTISICKKQSITLFQSIKRKNYLFTLHASQDESKSNQSFFKLIFLSCFEIVKLQCSQEGLAHLKTFGTYCISSLV